MSDRESSRADRLFPIAIYLVILLAFASVCMLTAILVADSTEARRLTFVVLFLAGSIPVAFLGMRLLAWLGLK
jgi:hypothetical protein